jgi:hypothetical protein
MTTVSCPKCRQALPDTALDAGACPLCGFPLDGPVVLSPAGGPRTRRWLAASVAVALLLVLAAVGYFVLTRDEPAPTNPSTEVAKTTPEQPRSASASTVPIAPMPRAVSPRADPPADAPPEPKKIERPLGVVMKVDPKITPKRHFDAPDDTAALPDLRTGDRVTLTGRVRVLRLGSVGGSTVLDASELVAEEVQITGDVSGDSQVILNAPAGLVTVGGYVSGGAKLTVAAPGGAVVIAGSGRIANSAQLTVTAKSLEVKCPVSDGARVLATLTVGGSLKLTRIEDGASVIYTKVNPTDPPLAITPGEVRDRARVAEGKK